MSAPRRQLGLDPGYGRLGYAVVEQRGTQWQLLDVGCVDTPATQAFELRLLALHDSVTALLKRWKPQEATVETALLLQEREDGHAGGRGQGASCA